MKQTEVTSGMRQGPLSPVLYSPIKRAKQRYIDLRDTHRSTLRVKLNVLESAERGGCLFTTQLSINSRI